MGRELDASTLIRFLPSPSVGRAHTTYGSVQVEDWFWEGLASEGDAKILYSSDLEGVC